MMVAIHALFVWVEEDCFQCYGPVMHISTKDKDTVKMDQVECVFLSCLYTTDDRSGTEFLLQFHMEREHPAPKVVVVEGSGGVFPYNN